MSTISDSKVKNIYNDIPDDCIRIILSMLSPVKVALVDKTQALESNKILNNSAIKIQKWYRSRRLIGDSPYEYITLKTLKRFYVVKYEKQWLTVFPSKAINKLNLQGEYLHKYLNPTNKMNTAFVHTFYQFCIDFDITVGDLEYYGW